MINRLASIADLTDKIYQFSPNRQHKRTAPFLLSNICTWRVRAHGLFFVSYFLVSCMLPLRVRRIVPKSGYGVPAEGETWLRTVTSCPFFDPRAIVRLDRQAFGPFFERNNCIANGISKRIVYGTIPSRGGPDNSSSPFCILLEPLWLNPFFYFFGSNGMDRPTAVKEIEQTTKDIITY